MIKVLQFVSRTVISILAIAGTLYFYYWFACFLHGGDFIEDLLRTLQ